MVSIFPDLQLMKQARSFPYQRSLFMRLVIFGLTITSSWGNGHATLWRGLSRSLARRGHHLTFFEKEVPYYAETRDLTTWTDGELILYSRWEFVFDLARDRLANADVALITSYCPDALSAGRLLTKFGAGIVKVFYDMDTPVTLQRLDAHGSVQYLPSNGLQGFDLVLSFTGGSILAALKERLGARRVEVLYGHADPDLHYRRVTDPEYEATLSYLGTFARDRQPALEKLFVKPAQRLPKGRFVLAGALYPERFPWESNIYFLRHLPPSKHGTFFSSSKCTLNLTRSSMISSGFCPSGRIFEAAACRTTVITDCWAGLEEFFEPGKEIIVAESAEDVIRAIASPHETIDSIGEAAYRRFLIQHTSDRRAAELESYLQAV
jgi:spore maturation protein CgeB